MDNNDVLLIKVFCIIFLFRKDEVCACVCGKKCNFVQDFITYVFK